MIRGLLQLYSSLVGHSVLLLLFCFCFVVLLLLFGGGGGVGVVDVVCSVFVFCAEILNIGRQICSDLNKNCCPDYQC